MTAKVLVPILYSAWLICAGHALVRAQELKTKSLATGINALKGSTDYTLDTQDVLIIHVVNEPSLAAVEQTVTSGGTIKYPHLGTLNVNGKTLREVEEMIRFKLDKDYIVNPQVLVNMKSFRRRTVSVSGAVNRPGLVTLPGTQKLDVISAVSEAGGFTRQANMNRIEITRKGKTKRVKLDDLNAITNPDELFWLEAGDVIFVKERAF